LYRQPGKCTPKLGLSVAAKVAERDVPLGPEHLHRWHCENENTVWLHLPDQLAREFAVVSLVFQNIQQHNAIELAEVNCRLCVPIRAKTDRQLLLQRLDRLNEVVSRLRVTADDEFAQQACTGAEIEDAERPIGWKKSRYGMRAKPVPEEV